jgi:hypothetical protein
VARRHLRPYRPALLQLGKPLPSAQLGADGVDLRADGRQLLLERDRATLELSDVRQQLGLSPARELRARRLAGQGCPRRRLTTAPGFP